ncbi:hypothetical protein BHE74_00052858 [Ensete ventricosum]|nr:hypothetical protein BHE74_00052858 [Ensete ventricosum]
MFCASLRTTTEESPNWGFTFHWSRAQGSQKPETSETDKPGNRRGRSSESACGGADATGGGSEDPFGLYFRGWKRTKSHVHGHEPLSQRQVLRAPDQLPRPAGVHLEAPPGLVVLESRAPRCTATPLPRCRRCHGCGHVSVYHHY